jgi:TatA/E family protein of Tat protein translocase
MRDFFFIFVGHSQILIPVFLLFFDISAGELVIILGVAFLVFGPKKLPEIARKVGKGLNELRRATDDIKREITRESSEIKRSFDQPAAKKTTGDKVEDEPKGNSESGLI